MWPSNHICNHCLESPSDWPQPILTTEYDSTYAQEVSGTRARMLSLMVFHPNAPSNSSRSLPAAYKKHEDEKKRTYGQRILEIEHGVFTPLVLSTSGGMGRETQTFYKRLADLLSLKRDVPYCSLMGWLRCKLSFATLRSAVMCIRGSRSSRHHAVRDSSDTVLVCAEVRVPLES